MKRSSCTNNKSWGVDAATHHPPLNTDTHIQRQTSWDTRSSEAPVTIRESVCWRGPPDAPLVPASSAWHTDALLAGTDRNVPGWKRQEQRATRVRAGPPSKLANTGTVLKAVLCVCGKKSYERSQSHIKVSCLGCLTTPIPWLLFSCCPPYPAFSCFLRPLIMLPLTLSLSFILSRARHSPLEEWGRGGTEKKPQKLRHFRCCCLLT